MSTPDRLRLVSHFPGRLRVRAAGFRSEVGDRVARSIGEEAGVSGALCTQLTGSILIQYDPAVLQLPALLDRLVKVGGLHGLEFDAEEWRIEPEPGERIRRGLGVVNDLVRDTTDGRLDLKTGFPVALGGLGLLRLLAGGRTLPEWYDLMMWSFTSFVALNPPAVPATTTLESDGRPGSTR